MRLVHSFNTRPLSIDCYGVDSLRRLAGNIWYFSLSVAYAKAAGAEIELHADSLGGGPAGPPALRLRPPDARLHAPGAAPALLGRRADARVKLILPGDTGHGQAATRIGYQHVVTSRKFGLLDKCRAALLAISPEIHEKTSRICRNISRE